MSETEFIKFFGKDVEIVLNTGEYIKGHCETFTRSSDNDNSIASLSIATEDGLLEVMQNEVDTIKTITL